MQVAARLRRDYVGIELKPDYIEMAKKRVMQGETGISVAEQVAGQKALFAERQDTEYRTQDTEYRKAVTDG